MQNDAFYIFTNTKYGEKSIRIYVRMQFAKCMRSCMNPASPSEPVCAWLSLDYVFMSVVNVSVFAYVSSFTHFHVCARLHTPWKICNRVWQMHVYLCMCPASHISMYVLDFTHLRKYVIGYGRCMFAYVSSFTYFHVFARFTRHKCKICNHGGVKRLQVYDAQREKKFCVFCSANN